MSEKVVKSRVKLITPAEAWRRRNSKVTPEVTKIFIEKLEIGLPHSKCCALAGISENAFYMWLSKGAAAADSPNPSDIEFQYLEFWQEVRAAEARFQVKRLTSSLSSEKFNPNWVRDITMLERRDRRNWGRNETVDMRVGQIPSDERFL